MQDIRRITLPSGETRQIEDATSRAIANRIYEGVDLEVRHAAEIAAAPFNGDPWAWIRARIRAGDYRGINVGDFIPFDIEATVSGAKQNVTMEAQAAGIDTYTRFRRSGLYGHHIDFISRFCFPEIRAFNQVDYNNGIDLLARTSSPFGASDIFAWLNGRQGNVPGESGTVSVDYRETGVFPRLPESLRNTIAGKQMETGGRYTRGVELTDDNRNGIFDDALLWLPTEIEIFGRRVIGSPAVDGSRQLQYPLFSSSALSLMKAAGSELGFVGTEWWTATAASGNSTSIVAIGQTRARRTRAGETPNLTGAPICFRIQ